MRRAGLIALSCALFLAAAGPVAAAPNHNTALIVFIPAKTRSANLTRDQAKGLATPQHILLKRLENRPQLALGYTNATQGTYSQGQTLLDMSQGTRVSAATYNSLDPPPLTLHERPGGLGGVFEGWFAARKRADSAPATVDPGLLASAIPGGAGYAGYTPSKSRNIEAIVAADRGGSIAAVSIGSPATVAARAEKLLQTHRLVVVGLSPKREGGRQLDKLLAARTRNPDELIIVCTLPPDFKSTQLLPTGIVSNAYKDPHRFTAQTTRRNGIIAAIDFAPTVLNHLGLKIDKDVRGQPITPSGGTRSTDNLEALKGRLASISHRRIPTLEITILFWIGLLFALGAIGGWHQTRRRGLRIGALACFWSPTAVLASAVVDPGRNIYEAAFVAALCFTLGALTDRFVSWPRGPAVPMFVGLAVYTIDLFRNSDLIARSLLGPNPRFGSRFFGLGNELETILPIMMLVGLAAVSSGRPASRKLSAIWGGAMLLLLFIMGSGRLGADVGAVFTVGAAVVAACFVLLPERPGKLVIVLGVLSPLVALGALALLDLATSGDSHFTRSVLHADSLKALLDIVKRRYELAYKTLIRGRMPAIVLAMGLAVAFAYRNRAWLYKPLSEPAWNAALAGSLSLAVIGSLFNDSGPLLFVIGVFVMAIITAYIQGDPALSADAANVAPVEETRIGETFADEPALEATGSQSAGASA
jgi:hypothetical protein